MIAQGGLWRKPETTLLTIYEIYCCNQIHIQGRI